MDAFFAVLSIVFAMIGIIGVLILTYYASRWYAKRVGPISGGRYIRVLDRMIVSKTGSILIIELQGIQYLVGATEQGIQILKQLEEPLVIPEEDLQMKPGFSEILKKYSKWKGED